MLQILDSSWMEHLRAMDHLRSSVGLRGYAQVDPKVEYKREGMKIFEEMWSGVGDKVTDLIFRMEQVDPDFLSYLGHRWQLDRASTIHEAPAPELEPVGASAPRRRRRRPRPAGRRDRRQQGRGQARAPAQHRQEGRPQRPLPVRLGQEVQGVLHAGGISSRFAVLGPRVGEDWSRSPPHFRPRTRRIAHRELSPPKNPSAFHHRAGPTSRSPSRRGGSRSRPARPGRSPGIRAGDGPWGRSAGERRCSGKARRGGPRARNAQAAWTWPQQ